MTLAATRTPATHAERATRYAAEAAERLAAGFLAEARRKEALALTNRAYEALRTELHQRLCWTDFLPDAETNRRADAFEPLSAGLVFDLHQWQPAKHGALFAGYPEFVGRVNELAELRAAIKAADVEPKPARQDHPLLAVARTSGVDLAALRDRHAATYRDTLDLGRKLGGLPVSVHRVFCANYGGSTWIRLDWYLRGKRTPFSIIAGAYDTLVREGSIKEDDQ